MYTMFMSSVLIILMLAVSLFAVISYYICTVAVIKLVKESKREGKEGNKINIYKHISNIVAGMGAFILFLFAKVIMMIELCKLYLEG